MLSITILNQDAPRLICSVSEIVTISSCSVTLLVSVPLLLHTIYQIRRVSVVIQAAAHVAVRPSVLVSVKPDNNSNNNNNIICEPALKRLSEFRTRIHHWEWQTAEHVHFTTRHLDINTRFTLLYHQSTLPSTWKLWPDLQKGVFHTHPIYWLWQFITSDW